jgi:hypothetical protein
LQARSDEAGREVGEWRRVVSTLRLGIASAFALGIGHFALIRGSLRPPGSPPESWEQNGRQERQYLSAGSAVSMATLWAAMIAMTPPPPQVS